MPGFSSEAALIDEVRERLVRKFSHVPKDQISTTVAPRKVDDADAAKARSLREKGITATDIAKMLGVSRATVYRYLAVDAA